MRVELTNREVWIERVTTAIRNIKDKRAKEDAAFEAQWASRYHSRGPIRRFLFGPHSEKPVARDASERLALLCVYPSCYAWGDLQKLTKLLRALQSENTGAIYIDGDELRAIRT